MTVVTFLVGLTVGLASAALIRWLGKPRSEDENLSWELEEFRF